MIVRFSETLFQSGNTGKVPSFYAPNVTNIAVHECLFHICHVTHIPPRKVKCRIVVHATDVLEGSLKGSFGPSFEGSLKGSFEGSLPLRLPLRVPLGVPLRVPLRVSLRVPSRVPLRVPSRVPLKSHAGVIQW